LLEQIRTIDKSRLKEKMGHLDTDTMLRVNNAITVSFGLSPQVDEAIPVASMNNQPIPGLRNNLMG
jgi:hypothetical protein